MPPRSWPRTIEICLLALLVLVQFGNALGVTIQGLRRLVFSALQWTSVLLDGRLKWTSPPIRLAMGGGPPAKADAKPVPDDGNFASVACSLLMQALWATRLARPDLLRAVNHVATKALKWTSTCDSMVHRLVGYTQATLHLRMIGWVGVSHDKLFPHFFVDA